MEKRKYPCLFWSVFSEWGKQYRIVNGEVIRSVTLELGLEMEIDRLWEGRDLRKHGTRQGNDCRNFQMLIRVQNDMVLLQRNGLSFLESLAGHCSKFCWAPGRWKFVQDARK